MGRKGGGVEADGVEEGEVWVLAADFLIWQEKETARWGPAQLMHLVVVDVHVL